MELKWFFHHFFVWTFLYIIWDCQLYHIVLCYLFIKVYFSLLSSASSERTAYTWLPDTRIEFCSPYSRRKSSNSTVYESDWWYEGFDQLEEALLWSRTLKVPNPVLWNSWVTWTPSKVVHIFPIKTYVTIKMSLRLDLVIVNSYRFYVKILKTIFMPSIM